MTVTPRGSTQRRRKTDPLLPPRTWISNALHELAGIFNQDRTDLLTVPTTERTHDGSQ